MDNICGDQHRDLVILDSKHRLVSLRIIAFRSPLCISSTIMQNAADNHMVLFMVFYGIYSVDRSKNGLQVSKLQQGLLKDD